MTTFTCTSCDSKESPQGDDQEKSLVVYFSATGTTASVARMIAEQTGAELCEIQPKEPYTEADLDWRNPQSRSSVEMNDPASRPAIMETEVDVASCGVVYLGYPIWWDLAPTAVNTFIEGHDMKGKRVIPFATSGGSSIENSVKQLKKRYPDVKWERGKLLNGASAATVEAWLKKLHQAQQ